MDTTTVNFALNKMGELWQKAAPSLQNVSEEYVRFVVMQQVLQPAIAFLIMLFCIYPLGKSIKYGIKEDWNEGLYFIPLVACSIIAFISGAIFFIEIYDAILALCCPEMFTINQIISSVKQ